MKENVSGCFFSEHRVYRLPQTASNIVQGNIYTTILYLRITICPQRQTWTEAKPPRKTFMPRSTHRDKFATRRIRQKITTRLVLHTSDVAFRQITLAIVIIYYIHIRKELIAQNRVNSRTRNPFVASFGDN